MAKEASAKEKLTMKLEEHVLDVQMENIREADAKDAHLCTKLGELGPTSVATDPKYYEVEVDGWIFWVNRETLEIISQGKAEPVYPEKIEVTNKNIEVYIGEGKAVELKLTPNNASKRFIKYTSLSEDIATVSNGVVTGIKEGTTEITIESTEDGSIKDTCTVTVKAVELTGINLNKTETTIGVGKTETLTVTYTPSNATYKDIKWTTADSTIAIVDESTGIITGIKAGETTITATSVKYPNIKAECKVTIEEIIEISTIKELEDFRDSVNKGNNYAGKKVTLMDDLDLKQGKYTISEDGTLTYDDNLEPKNWLPIGNSSTDKKFSGTFDGKNHTIKGLYISKTESSNYQGLFGYIDGGFEESTGIIENLILEDVNIDGVSNYIGGIAGKTNYGKIINCGVSGDIKGTGLVVGGIVGESGGNISGCYNYANITNTNISNSRTGGIVGLSGSYCNVSNCYNKGKITSSYYYVGGIVGEMQRRKN